MKWFKHETDAHTNLKLQAVIDKFGLEAYAYYWMCVELVALQGENFTISSSKLWKVYLKKISGLELEKQELFLQYFSSLSLIDEKALKKADLFIPKLAERSDDYTNKVRRKSVHSTDIVRTQSEHGTDNVPLEEKRTEKKRREQKRPDIVDKAELKTAFFENPIFETYKKKYPDRDYNLHFEEMCQWYLKNKGRLPQMVTAFGKWLSQSPVDQVLAGERKRRESAEETRRMIAEREGVPRASPEVLEKFKQEKTNLFKNNKI